MICLKPTLIAATLLFVTGCSRSNVGQIETYPVSGKLMVDGKPAHGASVFFVPAESLSTYPKEAPEHLVGAIVDENGEFQVTTNGVLQGSPEGKYALAFNWFDPEVTPDPDAGIRGRDLMPAIYRDARTSGIVVTVEPTDGQQAAIELTVESQQSSERNLYVILD